MIVITGGAGFIGSALLWKLNKAGRDDILIVDHLKSTEKWKNLVNLNFIDFIHKDEFIEKIERGLFDKKIETIFHMGACSATTELNADYLIENNFHYTMRLARYALNEQDCRFIYASSAATYGDGSMGYDDQVDKLHTLKPLNMYGYSKHLFDLYARRQGWLDKIVGLKFFNVFGPNEYHKDSMRSLVCKSYERVRDDGVISLFKSHHPDYKDGEQLRDFIYIKDAVEMTMHFFHNRTIGGLFNIGTGNTRSWNDIARSLEMATKRNVTIQYVPMPESIRDKYQYYTKANIDQLRLIGCSHICMSLEDSISDYVNGYLRDGQYLA
jgi:ADP-L-glycero-D-manno-heptose 6-epimerase